VLAALDAVRQEAVPGVSLLIDTCPVTTL